MLVNIIYIIKNNDTHKNVFFFRILKLISYNLGILMIINYYDNLPIHRKKIAIPKSTKRIIISI